MSKQRVAILGGGIGALTAAFELTEHDVKRELYDITVYQVGWRLGGKAAVGWREGDGHRRAEEHGLHVWAGYYDNAFDLLQRCYAARGDEAPFQPWQAAFQGLNHWTVMEQVGAKLEPWLLQVPPNPLTPGIDDEPPSVVVLWQQLLTLTANWYGQSGLRDYVEQQTLTSHRETMHSIVWRFPDLSALTGRDLTPLNLAAALARKFSVEPQRISERQKQAMNELLALARSELSNNALKRSALQARTTEGARLRHFWILLDLGLALVKGIFDDDVIFNGFDQIDGQEWRAWMRSHDCESIAQGALTSELVKGIYNYIFAEFEPGVGAGTGTRALLRLLFTYKGSLFYKLNATLGEIIVAPLYQVLKSRGVKFAFFNRVKKLKVGRDTNQTHLTNIEIEVQAYVNPAENGKPAANGDAEYDPLDRKGRLPSWPACPDYSQLKQGATLKDGDFDLESAWTDWTNGRCTSRTLTAGEAGADGFDIAILGISLGAFRDICDDLINQLPKWGEMVDKVKTTPIMALQLWLKKPLPVLSGWSEPQTIATAFRSPLNTWADNSQLLEWEIPRPQECPMGLAYFCGNFVEKLSDPPPARSNPDYARGQQDLAKTKTTQWITDNLTSLWPGSADAKGAFDWACLYDPQPERAGSDRLEAQFVRANINPSDRYVLSVPGSVGARLQAGDSGLKNLYLAGDWVHTGLNAGCIEAAVMSGRQAARSITGAEMLIPGESDFAGLGNLRGPIATALPFLNLLRKVGRATAAGVGSVDACCAVAWLEREFVERMLPAGLALTEPKMLPQSLGGTAPLLDPKDPASKTNDKKYPVVLAFCRHSRVRPGFAPFGGINYLEFFEAIPFVKHRDQKAPTGQFNYLPHLLLDEVPPILVGVGFYGFKKRLARIRASDSSFDVRSDLGRIDASFADVSAPGGFADFGGLAALRTVFELPQISQSQTGQWIYSFLNLRLDAATFQGVEGKVIIGPPFVPEPPGPFPGLPRGNAPWRGNVAFRFATEWELSLPIVSSVSDESPVPRSVNTFADAWVKSRLNW